MSSRCPQVLLSAAPDAEDYAWPDVRIRPRTFESRPFRPSDEGLILFAYIPFCVIGVVHKLPRMSFFPFFYSLFLVFFTPREAALKDQGRLRVNLQSSFSPTALIASDLCGSVLGCINKNLIHSTCLHQAVRRPNLAATRLSRFDDVAMCFC